MIVIKRKPCPYCTSAHTGKVFEHSVLVPRHPNDLSPDKTIMLAKAGPVFATPTLSGNGTLFAHDVRNALGHWIETVPCKNHPVIQTPPNGVLFAREQGGD